MATVQRPEERYVDFDEYIDLQLDKARNGIKWTDILAAAAGVGALVIAYLVLFVIADHWLFEGGIPTGLRQILLSIVGVIAVAWIGWKVVWPYLRRVNDLYAAQMLERAEPSLRGSLFGLVDSRRAGRPPIEEVRKALERRAATTLSDVDVDAALDRRLLMRMSYVLLGVVLFACIYAIASPKRVGPSLLRALLPASNIGVATRTEILDVRPGNTAVLAGEQLSVSVMIRGETPDKVMLFYSTVDRRFVDEPIELRLVDETTREYQATLIGDAGRGLAQDLSYRIVANDDAAGPFAIDVDQPPAANIKAIALQYPPYSGLEPIERETPPVEGIEGTNVALTAVANRPLKSAKLVFADDELFLGRGEEVPLRISDDGLTLTASWKLAIRSDGSSPTFFRIECRDGAGKTNPKPAVYPVKILADAAPEVTLHDPKSDLERPSNAIIPLLVTARDPDFRLRELTLRIEKRGQELPDRTVLWEGSAPEAAVRHDWDLGPLALKPGDIVSFYVQARDNREPEANRRNTPKLNIKITEPVAKEEVQQQLEEEKKRQDEEVAELEQNAAGADAEQQPNDEQLEADASETEKTQNDQQAQNENAEGSDEQQEGAQETSPNDGNERSQNNAEERDSTVKNDGTQDDKVLRKLLERQREQQQQEAKADQQQQDNTSSEKNQPNEADQSQPNEKQSTKPGEKGEADGSAKGDDQQQQSRSGDQGENRNDQANGPKGSEKRDQPQNGKPNGERSEQSKSNDGNSHPQNASDQTGEQSKDQTGDESGESGSKGNEKADQKENSSATESNDAGPAGSESPKGEGNAGQNASAKGSPQDQNEKSATGEGTSAPMESGDSERSDTKPKSSQPTDEPAGSADPNPGEGRPDQKSQKPDSGEQGTGQPNVDGTPDTQKGPGDAGTQPGSQQESNESTGQSGVKATEKGRPGEGTSEQANDGSPSEKQATDAQKGEPSSKMSDPAQPSEQNAKQDEKSKGASSNPSQESEKTGTPKPSEDSTQQPGAKQSSSKPSEQPSDNADGKSSSNKTEPSANEPAASDSGKGEDGMGESGEGESGKGESGKGESGKGESGKGESGKGESGKGESGKGESGKGESGKGESGKGESGKGESGKGESGKGESGKGESGKGESGKGESGKGESGKGESGKGESGKGEAGKGEAGGAGGQPGESGQPGQGGKSGQPGGKPGAKGGEGGGAAPANGGEGAAEGDGAGDSESSKATAEEANPEYTKQATDLALKKLQDDLARGEVDPELLKDLGWTEEDMRRFADRLRKNLDAPTGEETAQELAHRKEFEHLLENLTIEGTPQKREGRNDRVRNVEGVGAKRPPIPSAYRDAYETFTRRVAGRRRRMPHQPSSKTKTSRRCHIGRFDGNRVRSVGWRGEGERPLLQTHCVHCGAIRRGGADA